MRSASFVLFLAVLVAFVAESQATQYLQTTLGYQQPYFIFYIVHSSFSLTFPVHLIYVLLKTRVRLEPLWAGLVTAQVTTWNASSLFSPFSVAKLVVLILCVTAFYNVPALLWFIAVPLASVTDVTAIWNANAFFAYLLSVKLLGIGWGYLRLFAVSIATLGVITVLYGGTTAVSMHSSSVDAKGTPRPFVGDMLTLVASLLYALYQVLYKKYIALPSDAESVTTAGYYGRLSDSPEDTLDEQTATILRADDIIYPPPFGLHSNMVVTAIGLCTLLFFWIPIPILHYYQIETFRLPQDTSTVMAIVGIAASGVIFNAGFMILLGIWGPTVTSVGNLLTIVLTLLSDLSFGTVALTSWGLAGAGMILCAFAILVYDMVQTDPQVL